MRAAAGTVSATNMASSPIIFTTRPPPPVTVSWASSSKRLTTAASSSSDSCWLKVVNPTMSANPTASTGSVPSPLLARTDMARRMAAWTWRRHTNSSRRAMAGSDTSAMAAMRSAASTEPPLPAPVRMPRSAGETSASAMRAMLDPMTRASCTPVSTSATPRSMMERRTSNASMSRSVNMGSSGATSGNPSARQKRRNTSRDMPVRSATSPEVNRRRLGTSSCSATSRSSTSSASARSISSSGVPRLRRKARTLRGASPPAPVSSGGVTGPLRPDPAGRGTRAWPCAT